MTIRHGCAVALLVIGTGVLLLCAVWLVVLPRPYQRLHALSPATSVGGPLVVLALAVETGPGRAAVKLLLIGAIMAAGGAVTAMAIGRATAQRDRLVRRDSPQ
ncbi:monovalent cation/H(+) antiporter subunit G [Streptomyces sp. NPDC050625]|uniref:cation:proton antiporter n=1 Tax=Streptomyces sp. NPDC050625 TaxID=3154629 RepID=UPI003445B0E7